MNALFLFEAKRSMKYWLSYLAALILIFTGIFCGSRFNLSVGEGIYLNSSYTIGFMTGMLSLSTIFFGVIYALQLLFKDQDSKFDIVLFSFPLSKAAYINGKFMAYFLQTFVSFCFLMLGFIIGQAMRTGSEMQAYFNLFYYLYPLVIFGLINAFFVCSFLFLISMTIKKKLLTVAGGLLLYVFYMVVLVFSNSPFMAGSIPQSMEAQQLSAFLDPFGLSSYFLEARQFTVQQKNTMLVPLAGYWLWNRTIFLLLSGMFLLLSYRMFSFSRISKQKTKKEINPSSSLPLPLPLPKVLISNDTNISPDFKDAASAASVLSFARIDLIYLFKSITVPAVSILLLFFVGMEMYAEIEKGIRLPQKYAGSGLMATTISENFPLFGLLVSAYFLNDLYWRSRSSGFFMIEGSTFFSKNRLTGHFLSVSILLSFFTAILIIQGIIFQAAYQYFHLDWNAYLAVFLFNTFPLILFSGFVLLINDHIPNKFMALGVSVAAVFILTGPVSGKVLPYPLFRIFSDFRGDYSDFNGYGIYPAAFAQRLLFGAGVISCLWILNQWIKIKKLHWKQAALGFSLMISGIFAGVQFMKGYLPKDEEKAVVTAAQYEKKFRKYENIPQPLITDVITEIQLYPSENAYQITGKYILKNSTQKPVDKILIHFNPDLEVQSAVLTTGSQKIKITDSVVEVSLPQPMLPGGKAVLDFKLTYKWYAINGHQSFNAIIENGSFIRISRYYPVIGYQKNEELKDSLKRSLYHLGQPTGLKKPEAPEVSEYDFINLDMTISTEKKQTAVGTGDLVRQWTESGRKYFRYKADNIPFRFAVSSAEYQLKSVSYKGITLNVWYHEKHAENVEHLIENARITLDYCRQNFGEYPFKTISFAEISSFTRGVAATAYPSAIFMPENMVFHANIHADQKQDVINELAGHELSHLWWGNSQIAPDDREGSSMLTETLAMYTEMMLYKKMHGKDKMMERIKVHQQIYDNEKGLYENPPIYKATGDVPHIAYSKGAVAMVRLSELIGEPAVNKALKNFLRNNQYPKKPSSLDLIHEFYNVSPDAAIRKQIDQLFKTSENIPSGSPPKGIAASKRLSGPIGSF